MTQRKTLTPARPRGGSGRSHDRAATAIALAVAAALSTSAVAQDVADEVGLTALILRVGQGNQPTGAGIRVGQTEAQESAGNCYPNSADPAFAGKAFMPMSGSLGPSGHATLVGQRLYGLQGIAPGIAHIHTYQVFENATAQNPFPNVNGWLQCNYLKTGPGVLSDCSAGAPLPSPSGVRVFNNSWIGALGEFTNEAIRRADFAADRDDVLIVNGVNNNGAPQQPLMTDMFNGLAVGLTTGTHTSSTTVGVDGPGRRRPDIVAPDDVGPGIFTSFATPVVGAAGALMFHTADLDPCLNGNTNARKVETIKAALLAGANHRAGWSNDPVASGPSRGVTSTPLDDVYGVDVVNVDRSHMILTGREQHGSSTIPASRNIRPAGWDFASLRQSGTLNYRFAIAQQVSELSVLAAWNRTVDPTFVSYTVADFDLALKRLDPSSGQFVSLVGDAGLPHFASGNVVSQSAIDNVEHLFVRNLNPGVYLIELRRVDALGGTREVALAWLMPPAQRPGDVNGDNRTDVDDLIAVILGWGACPPCSLCPSDLDNDGATDVDDLITVILGWG